MAERTKGVEDSVNTNGREKPVSGKVDEVMRMVDTLDYSELLQLRDLIGHEYIRKTEAARVRAIAEAREKFERLGLSFEDVITIERKRKSTVRAAAVPKYMSPEGVPWSGRGATPKWVREIEEAGGNRDDYLIKEET